MDNHSSAIELAAETKRLWIQIEDPDPRSQEYADADGQSAIELEAVTKPGVRRSANWIAAIRRYEAFGEQHDRSPRENTRRRETLPAFERRLAEWARYQRRFEGGLCRYQETRLDISPWFLWDPQDAQWQVQLDACMRWTVKHGQLPRLNAADRNEFLLARWINRQLRQMKTAGLIAGRLQRFERLLALVAE
jgi:hypothetical protein